MGTLASGLRPIAHDLAHAPRVYVDANMPAGIVAMMRQELAWDVLFVMEHDDLRRASDEEHFRRAAEYGRTLFTLDYDFFSQARFPAERSPGVVVCSAPDEMRLATLLREFHQSVFGAPDAGPTPLRGRTVELAPGAAPTNG